MKKFWKKLSYWKKFVFILIVILLFVNVYAIFDVIVSYLQNNNVTCPKGFSGYMECSWWQAILSVAILLNFMFTIPAATVLFLIFILIRIFYKQ